MHILVLPSWYPTPDDPIRGSFFVEQSAALARFGHRVTVFAVYNDGKSGTAVEKRVTGTMTEYLIHVKPLPFHLTYFRVMGAMRGILRTKLREVPPEVIHVHSFRAIRYARGLRRTLGIPFVVTEHVTWFEREMLSKKELRTVARDYSAADRVFAVGDGLRDQIQPLCKQEVLVIPNMVDKRFLENGLHAPRGETFRFMSVGLADHRKGFDLLLRAFAQVHAQHPETRLTICGDGSELQNLLALRDELGLSDHAELPGSVSREECARRMKESLILVLPSRHETFGVVLVEAMGLGLPIIMTKTSAWKALVRPETGLAVEIEDVEGLTEAMLRLMDTYDTYDPAVISEFCRKNFSEQAVCERLTAEYGRVIAGK